MSKKDIHTDTASHSLTRIISIINLLIKEKGLNETQLARGCGLPQPTVHRLLAGETDPRLSTLVQIANFFQISLGELSGDVAINEKKAVAYIPIIPCQDVKKGSHFISTLNHDNWTNWTVTNNDSSKGCYAVISSKNMEPRFQKNTILIVNPNISPTDGDLVVVLFKSVDEVAIREILIDGPIKQLRPVAANSENSVILNKAEHKVMGVITQLIYHLI